MGAVNHWTTVVVHKEPGQDEPTFYLLDSANLCYLDKIDEQLPEIMEKRSREKA